jgi:hypothetical protein
MIVADEAIATYYSIGVQTVCHRPFLTTELRELRVAKAVVMRSGASEAKRGLLLTQQFM